MGKREEPSTKHSVCQQVRVTTVRTVTEQGKATSQVQHVPLATNEITRSHIITSIKSTSSLLCNQHQTWGQQVAKEPVLDLIKHPVQLTIKNKRWEKHQYQTWVQRAAKKLVLDLIKHPVQLTVKDKHWTQLFYLKIKMHGGSSIPLFCVSFFLWFSRFCSSIFVLSICACAL